VKGWKKKKNSLHAEMDFADEDNSKQKRKKNKKKNRWKRSAPEKDTMKSNRHDGPASQKSGQTGRWKNKGSNWKKWKDCDKSKNEKQRVYHTRSQDNRQPESSLNYKQKGKSSSRQSGGNYSYISERGFKASRSKTSY
jgi:hypothetical protein